MVASPPVTSGPDEPAPGGDVPDEATRPDQPAPRNLLGGSANDDLAWLNRHPHNRHHDGNRHHGASGRGRRHHHHHRHHWYRPRNTIGFPLLALLLVVVGFVLYVNHELSSIRRTPLNAEFGGPPSAGTNVLLVASNAPSGSVRVDAGTMVLQLIHLSDDGTHASLIDIPRDLLLPARTGAGRATIAATYARAGTQAVASEVQDALGITLTHVLQVDFAGYVRATDRLGGVEVRTETGVRHLTGDQARAYVDQTGVASIVTGQRAQHWLRGIVEATLTPGVILNPIKLVGLLHDMMPNLILDDTLTNGTIRSLAWHSRGLSPTQTRYLTVPVLGYRRIGGATVLLPDTHAIRQLGAAIRADNDSGIAVFGN